MEVVLRAKCRQGFAVQRRQWGLGRTFDWLSRFRWLVKNPERRLSWPRR
jgi:hypothetical protein